MTTLRHLPSALLVASFAATACGGAGDSADPNHASEDSVTASPNLARNRPVTVSSVEPGTSFEGRLAFDGDTKTRWSSRYADPEWIAVDLGAEVDVQRVRLIWEVAYSKAFRIQVSRDNARWTDVYSTSSGTGGTQDLTGLSGRGRYVRLLGLGRGTPWGHSLWEMEVYGTPASPNLALNRPVTVSSVEPGTSFEGRLAFDGDLETRWSSRFADPEWIAVDLGAEVDLQRVRLIWEVAYSKAFRIQVSSDNARWTDLYSTSSGAGGTQDLAGLSGRGRYVRLLGLGRGTPWGHSLWEMEVYGTPIGAPPAPPPPVGPGTFVSPSGNDANPGTKESPFRTLQKGVSKLKAGDTLYARGGTYAEKIDVGASGTAAAPIRILAYPGESPVIDGQGRLPTNNWQALVDVYGAYVEISGFEIKNGSHDKFNRGVSLWGAHDKATFLDVHHHDAEGIYASGDDTTVEDSRVWRCAQDNSGAPNEPGWSGALVAGRDFFNDKVTSRAAFRRNVVFDNMGEGLMFMETSDGVIEDNVVFNNWSVNIYLCNSWRGVVRRNLAYVTDDSPMVGARRDPSNISLMDESTSIGDGISTLSHDNVVTNNLTWGTGVCLNCWNTDAAAAAGAGLKNVLFAHNTIANGGLWIGNYAHAGSRIVNNILPAGTSLAGRAGIQFTTNFAGDPGFAAAPAFSNSRYDAAWLKLTPASRGVLGAGTPGVVAEDFFRGARPSGSKVDLGAHELTP